MFSLRPRLWSPSENKSSKARFIDKYLLTDHPRARGLCARRSDREWHGESPKGACRASSESTFEGGGAASRSGSLGRSPSIRRTRWRPRTWRGDQLMLAPTTTTDGDGGDWPAASVKSQTSRGVRQYPAARIAYLSVVPVLEMGSAGPLLLRRVLKPDGNA
jgi:hypothetical protein